MKLITFQVATPVGKFSRVGALWNETIVDLNMAYTLMLAEKGEAQPYRVAETGVPATMLEFLQGGSSSMNKAREAFQFVTVNDISVPGPDGDFRALRPRRRRTACRRWSRSSAVPGCRCRHAGPTGPQAYWRRRPTVRRSGRRRRSGRPLSTECRQ